MQTSLLRFRIVEREPIHDIIQWSREHMDTGADFILDGPLQAQFVVVPEPLLYEFLSHYGWAVSAL